MQHRWWFVAAALVGVLVAVTVTQLSRSEPTPDVVAGQVHAAEDPGFAFAVTGDLPYGKQQLADFPRMVAQINADADVQLVNHLGDIKDGATPCSDAYLEVMERAFEKFRDPLVYTPGDNEWTDCHRPQNGSYNPLERLAAVRDVFFENSDFTLGQEKVRVTSQRLTGYPENVRYSRAGVSFASVHIVGSNNGMAPWTGKATAEPRQTAEVLGRTAAAVQLIHDAFDSAEDEHSQAVVLLTQADMFPPGAHPTFAANYGYQPIVAAIAEESAAYSGSVYLFNGDSHVYRAQKPLAAGSRWLAFYGLGSPVANLTRVTIDGAEKAKSYVKVTIGPETRRSLTWTRVPFRH